MATNTISSAQKTRRFTQSRRTAAAQFLRLTYMFILNTDSRTQESSPAPSLWLAARCLLAIVVALAVCDTPCWANPPEPTREFRAAWIATVANIDWPSKPGLSPAEQRAEMIGLLDLAAKLGLNAVVLQVRPACDAIYPSELEPWSPYLTGTMGKAPEDGYDPLGFAVAEAHRRGLELHAWFNPYRALHPTYKGKISADHVSKRHPRFVRDYGTYQWLDPGDLEAAEHSRKVIVDVVKRYDIDAVHFDDYFYPYPVNDDQNRPVPFPDDESWTRYVDSTPEGEQLSRDDWRRENVNNFLRTLNQEIKQAKPWVRFGVSPFGIYRPGEPPTIKGFDPYEKLYADSRLWMTEGIVDYLAPQLYWPIDQKDQSFPVLLRWWHANNPHERHLWPGLYTSKVTGRRDSWPNSEIVRQIETVRKSSDDPGHIHFSIKALKSSRSGLGQQLREEVYHEPALPPATPWCTLPEGANIEFTCAMSPQQDQVQLKMSPQGESAVWLWLVQWRIGERWAIQIVPGSEQATTLPAKLAEIEEVAVRHVDRLGQLGPVVTPTN
jgi:uncharacterized lipoprotein YddW (UPF0748 family)